MRLRAVFAVAAMVVFKRSISATGPKVVPVGTVGPWYCANGSRSLRGASGTRVPYTALSTRANTGLSTKLANCESSLGWLALKVSFEPVPMTSSLISGLPMRVTWTRSPEVVIGPATWRTVVAGR